MTANERAVIFVRSDEFDPHANRCMAYVQERGYELVGIVQDDWEGLLETMSNENAPVAVVSEESHLPADRRPRLEVVANMASDRRYQRTRIIRRAWVRSAVPPSAPRQ